MSQCSATDFPFRSKSICGQSCISLPYSDKERRRRSCGNSIGEMLKYVKLMCEPATLCALHLTTQEEPGWQPTSKPGGKQDIQSVS